MTFLSLMIVNSPMTPERQKEIKAGVHTFNPDSAGKYHNFAVESIAEVERLQRELKDEREEHFKTKMELGSYREQPGQDSIGPDEGY